MTVVDFAVSVSPPVISLGCSKTACLHTEVNEWRCGVHLNASSQTGSTFNCDTSQNNPLMGISAGI